MQSSKICKITFVKIKGGLTITEFGNKNPQSDCWKDRKINKISASSERLKNMYRECDQTVKNKLKQTLCVSSASSDTF